MFLSSASLASTRPWLIARVFMLAEHLPINPEFLVILPEHGRPEMIVNQVAEPVVLWRWLWHWIGL